MQTVETLIRRRDLRRLIWVCPVCLSRSTKRKLGLNELTNISSEAAMQTNGDIEMGEIVNL